ncbi:MAG: UbiD family decarboxylase [Candidatus Caldarchaeum sp.]
MRWDLRSWIENVKELGLLREVRGADWHLEIGAITDLNAKNGKYTLLFDEIKGYPKGFRILTGALLDSRRVALALGLPDTIDDLELVTALKNRMSKLTDSLKEYAPKHVNQAVFQENTMTDDDVDVLKFPAPKWMPQDGGRYIGTADVVVTKDPETGWVNVGTYRVMIQDSRTLTVFIEAPRHAKLIVEKYWRRGEKCPIAISLGHHPLIQLFAGIEVPPNISEYAYAGAIAGASYEIAEAPLTKLPVPAESEVLIEGWLSQDTQREGPLGEFVGYYASGVTQSPTIKVAAIHYRDDPIMLATCAGRPPYDYSYFRCPLRSAMIWDILEKAGIPGVRAVWCHEAGYSRAFTVVSIKQVFAGQDRMAGYVASQCRPGAIAGRYVIVVDEDIDPTNLNEVVWAMCTRVDPARDVEVIRDTVGTPLDPVTEHEPGKKLEEYTSSRMLVFATKPFSKLVKGEFPMVVEPDEQTIKRVTAKWGDLFPK